MTMGTSHRSQSKCQPKLHKPLAKRQCTVAGRPLKKGLSSGPALEKVGKLQRMNALKQMRRRKNEQAQLRRWAGAPSTERVPPRVVMLVPFKRGIDTNRLKISLASLGRNAQEKATLMPCEPITFQLPAWTRTSAQPLEGRQQKITLIDASPYLPSTSLVQEPGNGDSNNGNNSNNGNTATITMPTTTFVSEETLKTILDIAKVASVIVCVFSPNCSLEDPALDPLGYEILSALRAQGLATPLGVMVAADEYLVDQRGCVFDERAASTMVTEGICSNSTMEDDSCLGVVNPRKFKETRKLVSRFFTSEFGEDKKFLAVRNETDLKPLLRAISCIAPKTFAWQAQRGFLLAEKVKIVPEPSCAAGAVVVLEGYARGLGLTTKFPVHLTGIGDFILRQITALNDPLSSGGMDREQTLEELEAEAQIAMARDWSPLRPYDQLQADQTWPTAEELRGAACGEARGAARHAPGGAGALESGAAEIDASEYQRAWLDDGDATESDGSEGSTSATSRCMDDDDDYHDATDAQGALEEEETNACDDLEMDEENYEVASQSSPEMAVAWKKQLRFELEERSKEEMEFPDEVDTPADKPAKTRFARYRGLRSFKTSPWDPYEDLPPEYSRIYEFESAKATMSLARKQYHEAAVAVCGGLTTTGLYVRLTLCLASDGLEEVQKLQAVHSHLGRANPGAPLILSSLFPYERRVTVVHLRLRRRDGYTQPFPSKADAEIQCGFRRSPLRRSPPIIVIIIIRAIPLRFPAQPIFSHSTKTQIISRTTDKSKFERFLHPKASAVASVYAPVIFPPAPVLVLRSPVATGQDFSNEGASSRRVMTIAALGSVLDPDPRRVIVKRIVLTGYPMKVQRKKAIVRFMFFNPDDIRWFMPVELCSKKGLRGHIKEPIGTHGHMKCLFNAVVKQDDTICMNLYKRAFPRWFPLSWGGLPSQSAVE